MILSLYDDVTTTNTLNTCSRNTRRRAERWCKSRGCVKTLMPRDIWSKILMSSRGISRPPTQPHISVATVHIDLRVNATCDVHYSNNIALVNQMCLVYIELMAWAMVVDEVVRGTWIPSYEACDCCICCTSSIFSDEFCFRSRDIATKPNPVVVM